MDGHALPAPSPSSTATTTTRATSLAPEERASSETTIFTIYSMYGDEGAGGSWASDPAAKDRDSIPVIPQLNLSLSDRRRSSMLKPNGHIPNGHTSNGHVFNGHVSNGHTLAHQDVDSAKLPKPPPTRTSELAKVSAPNGSLPVSYSSARPVSGYTSSRSSHTTRNSSDHRRASTGHTYRTSDFTSSSSDAGPSRQASQATHYSNHPVPGTSRPSSRSVGGTPEAVHSELPRPNTAQTIAHLPWPPSPALLTPSPSAPTHASASASTSTPPLPLKHPAYTDSPSSKTSLVPSEGEDMDGFHVRNTYAQLEMSGVKGDGYEEGVERTRARIGASRASQMNAADAVGDGTEKTRDLDEKERRTLASLDRYGFFSIPSHDRLVLLAAAPLLKRLERAPAGPPDTPPHAKTLTTLPPTPLPLRETSRIAKWTRMLQPATRDQGGNIETWGIKPSKEAKLRERTYKGIPDRWRTAAWDLLMGRFARTGQREMAQWATTYRDTLDKPSSYDVQIDLDVPRTISGHVMFRTRYGAGQRSLFHVLHCFSLHCDKCGYVQGMGPIAATLLCYFDPERTYASLIRLHDAYAMHTIFSPGFPGLLEAIYVQERLTETLMPAVYAAFQKHMISTTSYATKWYITLFANSVPFQTQLRLWDAFLLEGQDVFVAVAVAIVWIFRDHITSASATFETVLSLLSSFFVPEDENALLTWIGKMLADKKIKASMDQWRRDWTGLVAAGKDATALL